MREYFNALLGCTGKAPTRIFTLSTVSKWPISSFVDDTDETRSQATLRNKRPIRGLADSPDTVGHRDIFRQVEVMHAMGRAISATVGLQKYGRLEITASNRCAVTYCATTSARRTSNAQGVTVESDNASTSRLGASRVRSAR